jgi:uncharacterized protein with beta-barrel porin domain
MRAHISFVAKDCDALPPKATSRLSDSILPRRAAKFLLRNLKLAMATSVLSIAPALQAPAGAQSAQSAFTIKIKDESGLTSENSNGLQFYYITNGVSSPAWTSIPFNSTTAPIGINFGIGANNTPGGVFQVMLAPQSPLGSAGTAVIGPGYTQLLEFSTPSTPGPSTFDISQVNNFSFPVNVSTDSSKLLTPPSPPTPQLGVPLSSDIKKQIDRLTIYQKYKSFASTNPSANDSLNYQDLSLQGTDLQRYIFSGNLKSPLTTSTILSQPQLILNPGAATKNGTINLNYNAIAVDVKDSPLTSAWASLYKAATPSANLQLYTPTFGSIKSATLGVMQNENIPPSALFGGEAKPIDYTNLPTKLQPNVVYYNSKASYTGLSFTGIPENQTANVPSPDDIAVSVLYKTNPNGFVVTVSDATKQHGSMTISSTDATKLSAGMFLVDSPGFFNTIDNGTTSDVIITSVASAGNNTSTISLYSPGGNLLSYSPKNLQKNSQVLFANVNDRTWANSSQQVWFNNAWPLNSNTTPDNLVYCGNRFDCDLSKYVGQIKLQINQAANWGTLAMLPQNGELLNQVWADARNWYKSTDSEENPQYNVYSAFWHLESGVSVPFESNTGLSSFGAAYGFQVDESAYQFPGQDKLTGFPNVQVPSEWNGTVNTGAELTITLLPWGISSPTPASCGTDLVCWGTASSQPSGGPGKFSDANAWYGSIKPSGAPFSLISFQAPYATAGGILTNDIEGLEVRGIEYLEGAAAYTITDKAIKILGQNGIAISNESGVQQIIDTPITLQSDKRLSLNVTEDSTLKLTRKAPLTATQGWRKSGTGLLIIESALKGPESSGSISLAGGQLELTDNSDLSNFSGFSSARGTTLSGSGILPGVPVGKSVFGTLIPGTDAAPIGTLSFAGALSIGSGGGAILHNLSLDPSQSDRINVNGNLSIDSISTALSVCTAEVCNLPVNQSYAVPLLLLSKESADLVGQFGKVQGLSNQQSITYVNTGNRKGVFLTNNALPPGDCIQLGDPTSTANPYSTTFCGGRLKVDSASSVSSWVLDNRGDNRIDQAGFPASIAFSGVFSGAGNLVLENSGVSSGQIINLSGTSTFTGPTSIGRPGGVNPVAVAVNGSILASQSLTVNSGSSILGNGFLPATNLNPGATIAPGNSIGTLTAAALDLNGGTINAEIQGPQNDRINVLGNVTNFVGNANLIPFGGGTPFPGFNYTIVSAPASVPFATPSSLTLNQSQVSSALLRAGTTLVQDPLGDPRSFTVQWRPNNPAGAVSAAMQVLGNSGSNSTCLAGSLDRAFSSLATAAAGNANSSGSAIGTSGFTTGQAAAAGMQPGFVDALNSLVQITSDSQLVAAVNSLSPQPYAAFQSVGLDTLKQQRESQLAQAGQCINNGWIINGKKAKNPLCAFAMAQNSTSSIRGGASLSSYNAGIFSSGFGLEYYPSSTWSIGGSYGYGTSYANNFSQAQAAISAAVNNVNLFSSVALSERWRLRGLLGYSNFNLTGSRSIAFLSGGSSLSASPNGNGFTAAIETDYAIPLTKATATTQALLKPLLGFAWGSYQQSGFSESGGPMSLNVNGNTANSFVTTAGLELSTSPIPINKSGTISLRPTLTVAYQVDALANNSANTSLSSTFSQASAVCPSCSTEGQNLGSSALNVAGGVDLQLSPTTSVYVNASYQAYSNASQFGYGGGLRMRF